MQAIESEAETTWEKAHELTNLQKGYIELVKSEPGNLQEVIRNLFNQPALKIRDIARIANVTASHAGNYARRLVDGGILVADERPWGRHYFAGEIVGAFSDESD